MTRVIASNPNTSSTSQFQYLLLIAVLKTAAGFCLAGLCFPGLKSKLEVVTRNSVAAFLGLALYEIRTHNEELVP